MSYSNFYNSINSNSFAFPEAQLHWLEGAESEHVFVISTLMLDFKLKKNKLAENFSAFKLNTQISLN